jgi:hypothetical protein
MTLQTRLSDLITAIGTDYKQLRTWITGSASGNLTGLTTTDKTSLVAAVNEVKASVGAAGWSAVDSSTTVKGITTYATDAEALAMASTTDALTPSNLAAIVNVNNGLVKLDAGGKVAAAQLPSYVDDVLEYANQAAFPGTGSTGIIYVAIDTNKTFRWTGSVYAEISASPGTTDSLTEGSTNLYFTSTRADARVVALVGTIETDLVALYTTAKA